MRLFTYLTFWLLTQCMLVSAQDKESQKSPKEESSLATEFSALKAQLESMRDQIDHLGAEVEVLRAQNRMTIQQTTVGFLDRFYFRVGMECIFPKSSTFSFNVHPPGVGLDVGIGKYFGRNHVAEAIAEYDIYAGMSFRYRYEFHNDNRRFAYGPIVGMKFKVAGSRDFYELHPILERPDLVNSPFLELGGMMGFSLTQSMITLETIGYFNKQFLVFVNASIHLFL